MTTLWRQLLSASLDSNSHLKHASYFQLATVKLDGRPANRTVVFRGFVECTDKLQVTTDSRTHKIEEINHCPYGEICWYFTDSWEQFRIQGKLDVIGEKNMDPVSCLLREKVWFASSLRSRLQYLGPHPSIALSNTEDVNNSLDPCTGPVGTFCLLTLDPEQNQSITSGTKNPEMLDSKKMAMSHLIRSLILDSMRRTSISYTLHKNLLYPKSDGQGFKNRNWNRNRPRVKSESESESVDYLNLKSNRRIVFKRLGDVDGNCRWMEEVNP